MNRTWTDSGVGGPILACALHAGRRIESDLEPFLAVDDATRLREEDPFTDRFASVVPATIVANHSRFEFDLNRPPETAVYLEPEDAWGIRTWSDPPTDALLARSRARHAAFFAAIQERCEQMVRAHGRFLILDLHSYNHRRGGPNAPFDDPEANPEVNLGTGTMERSRWAGLVDRFVAELSQGTRATGPIDVRENVKFRGGYMGKFVHARFPETGCVLSIEFKKTFMDEWTGAPDEARIDALRDALAATIPGLLESLDPS